ncbi:hypothetical protein ACHQM5_006588 [Ranunculus cassubicifolius]
MGLRKCIEDGFMKIWVSSDSLRVVSIIQGIEDEPWYCRGVVTAIKSLIHHFSSFRISHVFREINRAADHLAKLATLSGHYVSYFLPPFDMTLSNIVSEDKNKRVYERLY